MFVTLFGLLFLVPCKGLIEGDIKVFYNQVVESYGEEHAQSMIKDIELSVIGGDPQERLRWPGGVVPYVVDHNDYNELEITQINKLAKEMTNKVFPYVTIRPRMDSDVNYVMIGKPDGGCWSYVGMIGGMQKLSMGCSRYISRYIFEHEMMHALGFWHEQSRYDRDDYVKINYENIDEKYKSQFNKRERLEYYGQSYDYNSVLHYYSTAFSINGKPTIEATNPVGHELGGGKMSSVDIIQVRAMYGEEPKPTHKPTPSPVLICGQFRKRKGCKKHKPICKWARKKKRCYNI